MFGQQHHLSTLPSKSTQQLATTIFISHLLSQSYLSVLIAIFNHPSSNRQLPNCMLFYYWCFGFYSYCFYCLLHMSNTSLLCWQHFLRLLLVPPSQVCYLSGSSPSLMACSHLGSKRTKSSNLVINQFKVKW